MPTLQDLLAKLPRKQRASIQREYIRLKSALSQVESKLRRKQRWRKSQGWSKP